MIRKIFLSLLVFLFLTSTSEAANLANMAKVAGVRYSYGSGTVRIVIDLTKKVEFVETVAENPSRSIIDIKNAWIDPADKIETTLDSLTAKNLRVAQFDSETVRVVIETMAAIKPFVLQGGESGWRLVIDVGNAPFKENPDLNNSQTETPSDTKTDDKKVQDDKKAQAEKEKLEREKAEKEKIEKEKAEKAKKAQQQKEKLEREKAEKAKKAQKEKEKQERERLKKEKEKAKQDKDKDKNKDKTSTTQETAPTGIDKDLKDITGLKDKIIVIDPGHGGNDAGAIGPTGVMEKSVTLNVALELEKLLQAEGANVIMTRSTDKTVSPKGAEASDIEELQVRCDVANDVKADIFISIHADSFTKPEAKGTTAYYYSQSSDGKGQKLAESIRSALCEQIKTPSRGTKPCNFYVVRHCDMPATLIELAFISNPEEEQILNSAEGVLKAAQGILDGIEDYFG